MDIVELAQIVGTVTILLLFCLNFYIAIHARSYFKSGRVALLWTTIYVLFLFIVRFLSLLDIGTTNQLRIISGFTSLIPFLAVSIHLWLYRKIDEKI